LFKTDKMNHRIEWFSWQVLKTALVNGFLLNLFGWIGNAIILKGEWREAQSMITFISPLNISGPFREVLTLVPDFIYGYGMIIIYLYIGTLEGFSRKARMQTILIAFLFGLFTTYFGLVTANLLPLRIACLTTAWGLLTFFPAFWISLSLTKFDKRVKN
jgi:hypothetical protein